MRLGRVEVDGEIAWARLEHEAVVLLDGPPWTSAREVRTVPWSVCTLHAPVIPSKIVAVAASYPKHAAEMGTTPTPEPRLFLKAPSAVIGPDVPIELPAEVHRCDPEGELGLVVGRLARDLAPAEALAHLLGYTCVNDVTARDYQRLDKVYGRAKGFDTFCPVGPWIETDLDPRDLEVRTEVNGEVRARGRTSEMLYGLAELVAFVSNIMTLLPGDLIATGTPPGVAPLAPGDVVTVSVQGVGTLRNPVRQRTRR